MFGFTLQKRIVAMLCRCIFAFACVCPSVCAIISVRKGVKQAVKYGSCNECDGIYSASINHVSTATFKRF